MLCFLLQRDPNMHDVSTEPVPHQRPAAVGLLCGVKQEGAQVPLLNELQERGLGGSLLITLQAMYDDMFMSVRTKDGLSPCFQPSSARSRAPPSGNLLRPQLTDTLGLTHLRAAAQLGEQQP